MHPLLSYFKPKRSIIPRTSVKINSPEQRDFFSITLSLLPWPISSTLPKHNDFGSSSYCTKKFGAHVLGKISFFFKCSHQCPQAFVHILMLKHQIFPNISSITLSWVCHLMMYRVILDVNKICPPEKCPRHAIGINLKYAYT